MYKWILIRNSVLKKHRQKYRKFNYYFSSKHILMLNYLYRFEGKESDYLLFRIRSCSFLFKSKINKKKSNSEQNTTVFKGFAISVQGARHKQYGLPMQDASQYLTSDDYAIVAVADGHGGEKYRCFVMVCGQETQPISTIGSQI